MKEKVLVNQNEYIVIKLLGHGKGGYSYLVEKDNKQYVLKQIHHKKIRTGPAGTDVRIIQFSRYKPGDSFPSAYCR